MENATVFYSNIPVRNTDIVRIGFIQIKRSKRNTVFEDGIPFLVECIYNKAMMSLCVFADTKIFFSLLFILRTTGKESIRMDEFDVIVVGAGLAGLSCAYRLASKGRRVLVLEAHSYPGGRTSSFRDHDMEVESGLHRHIGYYSALPRLLKKCSVRINDIVTWEEKVDILLKGQDKKIVLGVAPFWGSIKMIRGLAGNSDSLSLRDKLSLIPFFLCGFASYIFSDWLDRFSVAEYAERHHVSKRAQQWILEPLSSGIFFLPPDRYSAYAFFGLFAPAIPKFYKMRIGAYLGGMTDIMCMPIVKGCADLGCRFQFGVKVTRVLEEQGRVTGVQDEKGQVYRSRQTVIAATLPAAKEILMPLKHRPELEKLFSLPEMSACTMQIELDQPALKKDVTTFGPSTDMVSFAEQSRSTFPQTKGRLSIILGNAEKQKEKDEKELFSMVLGQMDSLGVHLEGHVLRARKVAEANDFYALEPGNQKRRPSQRTGIPGLLLAGDYTRTASFATMEGAVLSGKKAARLCMKNRG